MSRRRGAILMEMMISLAIFVMAAMAIGAALRQSTASLIRSREQLRAADLARTAMARIEAGLARPETLNGPVEPWDADPSVWEGDSQVDSEGASGIGRPDDGGSGGPVWELEVETEPSEFSGLVIAHVRAIQRDPENPDRVVASANLDQLVRLRDPESDVAGEADELLDDLPEAPDGGRP